MAKHGILHDYDLMANVEPAAAKLQACAVCGSDPISYQWSDYSGEAMCRDCGAPYQLKWGSDTQRAEGKYPYLTLSEKLIPAVRAYYAETKRFTCLGTMMGGPLPGMAEFVEWCKVHHPELLRKRDEAEGDES